MLLSITLEKMVEAGEPYFLLASSASRTSSLLVHSSLLTYETEEHNVKEQDHSLHNLS